MSETNRSIGDEKRPPVDDNATLLTCQHCDNATEQVTQVRTHGETCHADQPSGSTLAHNITAKLDESQFAAIEIWKFNFAHRCKQVN